MKKLMILFMAVFVGSCATTSVENVQKATAHYKLGVSYLNENNVQPAFIEFRKAYELNPEDKEVLNAIGIIYLLKFEDFQKAIEFFQKAVSVAPDFSEAHNNLGFAYEKSRKFNEAIASYNKALSNLIYRSPEKAYYNLGRVYYRLGKYDEAINAYKEALKRMTDFYPSYYGLALCYNAKGRYGDASLAITKAIEIDPLYKGSKSKAMSDLSQRKLNARGEDEKDNADYLDILKY
ncbi:MAG: tetratricopeptide repeat protein [Thermodesulfovibrionales bacterium]|nr:tetratricopeptide repeat protein [Thermodesulfovibrionales bacterium]